MTSINLNDGTNVLLFDMEDALNVIKENLSHELAKYLSDAMADMKEEMEAAIFDYDDLKADFNSLNEENSRLIKENLELKDKIEKLEDETEKADDENALPFN